MKDAVHKVTPQVGGKLNKFVVPDGISKGIGQRSKTELKHSETQSFQRSLTKSQKQYYQQKVYRTPTAMDIQDNVFHFA